MSFPSPPTEGVLVLTAHPLADSFCHALADAWVEGASVPVRRFEVHDLDFDPVLRGAYREETPLEPDLLAVREAIEASRHLVVVTPLWWSSVPAALKGLFDRVLLPGWAFRYENGRPRPGLGGRSARVIQTLDAPVWYDWLFNGSAGRRQLESGTLGFCGFAPLSFTRLGSVGTSTPAQREAMLTRVRREGRQDVAVMERSGR